MNRSASRTSIIKWPVLAALLAVCLLLSGCGDSKGAEMKVVEDLENMRYVELDPQTDAEIEALLSDKGREYLEMFLGKAGEFEYEIKDSDEESDDKVIVHVHITTYDFASEYLRSLSDFLEQNEVAEEVEEDTEKGEEVIQESVEEALGENVSEVAEKASGEDKGQANKKEKKKKSEPKYDSAKLYESLFLNLSSVQEKKYEAYVDVVCTRGEDGAWQTDAAVNKSLRNALFGGMLSEISSLAELGDQ